MKLCPTCDQPVAEEIIICPSCGKEIGEGRKYIDDYRIVDVLQEGHGSLLCRAIRLRTAEMVMIRLFTPESGVNEEAAARLRRELEQLKGLPGGASSDIMPSDERPMDSGIGSVSGLIPRIGDPCSPPAG